jgi:hypothetical protein
MFQQYQFKVALITGIKLREPLSNNQRIALYDILALGLWLFP